MKNEMLSRAAIFAPNVLLRMGIMKAESTRALCGSRYLLATRVSVQIVLALSMTPNAALARDYFNPHALQLHDPTLQVIDLDQFADVGGQAPGIYRVDVYLNGNKVGTRNVEFAKIKGDLQPQLTAKQLSDLGVKRAVFPALNRLPDNQPFTQLAEYIPDASSKLNFCQQRLDISIPQAALNTEARGYVDPALWDQGISALLLNYSFTGSSTRYDNQSGTHESHYLNLRSGANLGAWRLRNYSIYTHPHKSKASWDSINTYIQRDVHSLKGRFTAGDSYTPGNVFESIQFRGMQLASDNNMLPDSLQGFAPVVRGIAQSNAEVTIRQNGYVIYQTYVAPGAFVIRDLYPTSANGNLEVIIKEAGGEERRFIQPFSALPVMVREGQLKYALIAGKYRSINNNTKEPYFFQTSFTYGLPYNTSLYGGQIFSEDYDALALGIGHGFGDRGSVSMDVIDANTQLNEQKKRHKGQSYRFQYANQIATTGTSFTLAGYRYSTGGFYDFSEANSVPVLNSLNSPRNNNKRSKVQINISQSLRNYGNLYISWYQQDFWNRSDYEHNLGIGYNLNYNSINYNLSYTYTQSPAGGTRNQLFAFSMQIPLSKWLPNSWATYSINTNKQGDTTQQAGISGTALADNNLNYRVQQSIGSNETGASGSAGATYKGMYGEVNADYNYNRYSQQMNYGVRGGILAHPYGVTLSQPLGDTLALVRAPGASGVRVKNNIGVYTDRRGYAVVPYMSTYRKNRIALDTQTLGENVDIDTHIQTVIPTSGALTLADFRTRVGSRILLTLNYRGKPVPFGATAALVLPDSESPPNYGIVDSNGQVYLSGVPTTGRVQVKWGQDMGQQCQASFNLPSMGTSSGTTIRNVNAICQ